jgi:hypothetical protein
MLGIAVNSENPEKSMEMINLIYSMQKWLIFFSTE